MNNNFYTNLGKNIKKYRTTQNFTQQELADKAGLGLNFLGKIEVAFSKPSLDTLIKISDALDISISKLTDFSEIIK